MSYRGREKGGGGGGGNCGWRTTPAFIGQKSLRPKCLPLALRLGRDLKYRVVFFDYTPPLPPGLGRSDHSYLPTGPRKKGHLNICKTHFSFYSALLAARFRLSSPLFLLLSLSCPLSLSSLSLSCALLLASQPRERGWARENLLFFSLRTNGRSEESPLPPPPKFSLTSSPYGH